LQAPPLIKGRKGEGKASFASWGEGVENLDIHPVK